MKLKYILCSIFISYLLPANIIAKCAARNTTKMVTDAKIIFLGQITKSSFENFNAVIKQCRKNIVPSQIPLSYTINPLTILKGKIDLNKTVTLQYQFTCSRSVVPMVFELNKKYLFAVKQVSNQQITLLSQVCGRWGWPESYQKELSLF